jgi:hypothetical protein
VSYFSEPSRLRYFLLPFSKGFEIPQMADPGCRGLKRLFASLGYLPKGTAVGRPALMNSVSLVTWLG